MIRRLRGLRPVAAVGGLALVLTLLPPSAGPAVAADAAIEIDGHGWGHGRGMGQYGALGYALGVDGTARDWKWIVNHYYGQLTAGGTTTLGQYAGYGTKTLDVELTAMKGKTFVATGTGLTVNGAAMPSGAVSVRLIPGGSGFTAETSTAVCGYNGVWTAWSGKTFPSGTVVTSSTDVGTAMANVCDDTANLVRAYHGSLVAVLTNGTAFTFNRVLLEQYLWGVVPRESPGSWGALGSGKGMNALRAQAVAARSYALAYGTRASGASICDSTECQVYGGDSTTSYDGKAFNPLWNDSATQAARDTAGQVVFMPNGSVARTEFSSSTGGYTAGGAFAAVVDDGDAVSSNSNHDWRATTTYANAGAKLGVGILIDLVVTQRDGHGADGGRVLQVRVTGTTGTKTMTGAEVQSSLGLKSSWFRVASLETLQAARSLVRALYQDVLLRQGESGGVESWAWLVASGASSFQLVGLLTSSTEYRRLRVKQAYEQVLNREPDEGGLEGWVQAIANGQMTVDDVARLFYQSPEFYVQAGNDDTAFVSQLYHRMLGRSASQSEIVYWVGQLPLVGRGGVAASVWFSREAAQAKAATYYQLFLGRAPEWSGRVYWGQVLLDSGEGAVRLGIAGSQEYWNRAKTRYPNGQLPS